MHGSLPVKWGKCSVKQSAKRGGMGSRSKLWILDGKSRRTFGSGARRLLGEVGGGDRRVAQQRGEHQLQLRRAPRLRIPPAASARRRHGAGSWPRSLLGFVFAAWKGNGKRIRAASKQGKEARKGTPLPTRATGLPSAPHPTATAAALCKQPPAASHATSQPQLHHSLFCCLSSHSPQVPSSQSLPNASQKSGDLERGIGEPRLSRR